MAVHQDDIDIDRNLKILFEAKDTTRFELTNFTNKDGRRLYSSDDSKQLAALMEREKLIRVYGDFCALERFGTEVSNNGGWLKHLDAQIISTNELELNRAAREELELRNLTLQNESAEYQKSIRSQEEQIRKLTADNLILGNWDIRFRWLIAIITFVIGFLTHFAIQKG